MRSYVLRVNTAHLKLRIEKNYLAERDLAYKGIVLCMILSTVQLQLDPNRIVFEEFYYDRMFRDNCLIPDLQTLLIRIGVVDPEIFLTQLEYLQEMLKLRYDARLMNFVSVNYDSGYFLNIHLKQTRS